MADQYLVNGFVLSWASIILKVDGDPFTGFKLINYADQREHAYQFGMGRHHGPRGRSAGKYTPQPCKLGGAKSSFANLRAKLASKASDGRSFGNVEFEADVMYVEPGSSELTIHDHLERCLLGSTSAQHTEGVEGLEEEADFSVMRITWNGLTLYDSSQEG
jgi:hypothetical protein